jgi:hypothetical protein
MMSVQVLGQRKDLAQAKYTSPTIARTILDCSRTRAARDAVPFKEGDEHRVLTANLVRPSEKWPRQAVGTRPNDNAKLSAGWSVGNRYRDIVDAKSLARGGWPSPSDRWFNHLNIVHQPECR